MSFTLMREIGSVFSIMLIHTEIMEADALLFVFPFIYRIPNVENGKDSRNPDTVFSDMLCPSG